MKYVLNAYRFGGTLLPTNFSKDGTLIDIPELGDDQMFCSGTTE